MSAACTVGDALNDPRLQQAFGDAIEGALAFGFQGNNQPPEGHWLWRFWNIGRAEGVKADAGAAPERSVQGLTTEECTAMFIGLLTSDSKGEAPSEMFALIARDIERNCAKRWGFKLVGAAA